MDFNTLKKNLKKDYSALKKVKVALLSDSVTDLLVTAIRGLGYERGYDFQFYVPDYGTTDYELLNVNSDLYSSNAEFVLLFFSTHKIQHIFYALDDSRKLEFAKNFINQLTLYYEAIASKNSATKIIYANFPEIMWSVFGNYATKLPFSFEYQLRTLNLELMNLSQKLGGFFINDLCKVHHYFGTSKYYDPRMHINADLVHAPDILPHIAKNTIDIIDALNGDFKKCIILDLDNTLWGGVIGDDGIENIQIGSLGIGKAFTLFQLWLKQLQQRGIILAVCSQNNEAIAKQPFINHPEMVLKLEDISLFVANWGSKAENIKYIQKTLNISLSSMVFCDDDPFQRNLVKTHLPEVCVPEMPQDPADYVGFLNSLNLFETSSYSEVDKQRGQYYYEELNREALKNCYSSEADYLKNLEMAADVLSFNAYTLPRVLQLIQRSNQFNLRTIRYTENQINELVQDKSVSCIAFALQDKFTNYDIVSLVILKEEVKGELFIDTWIMSCRVLKRGLEHFVLNHIVAVAKEKHGTKLRGEYIPTNKNALVACHYDHLNFQKEADCWVLNCDQYIKKECFISKGQKEYESLANVT